MTPLDLSSVFDQTAPTRRVAGKVLAEEDRARFADLLVAVATTRDRAAFSELFAYFAPRVKFYLMRLGADNAQAEETSQDVMVMVWRKARLFDRIKASVSTWVFRIACNRRIDVFRRTNKPGLDPEETMLLPSGVEGPDAQFEAVETEVRVRAALKDLPGEQLHLLHLSFYQGLSHSEIAAKLPVPLGTVKSRIRMASRKMKAVLNED